MGWSGERLGGHTGSTHPLPGANRAAVTDLVYGAVPRHRSPIQTHGPARTGILVSPEADSRGTPPIQGPRGVPAKASRIGSCKPGEEDREGLRLHL